jgi:hypothetical protein
MSDKIDTTGEDLVKAGQAAALKAQQEQDAADAINFEREMKEKLRENGKLLGITFSPNEGVPSMIQKLKDARAEIFRDPEDVMKEQDQPLSIQEERNKQRFDMLKLVRIQIACVNPNKSGLPGEIFTVHNDFVGTVKKFIPYQEAGEAYHVPMILLKFLKRKKFLQIKDPPKGSRASATTKLVPEFAITILDPLTEAELKELARAQGAAESAEAE